MRSSICATLCCLLALLAVASGARAQTGDPDIRNIPPFVMIVVDSSGSMEWLPACTCVTEGCTECLPNCDLSNDAGGNPPAGKKNRWAVLLEAMTGTFVDFQCKPWDRSAANGMTYDLNYNKPYNQPWVCPNATKPCDYTTDPPVQTQNGLLDNYAARLQFGLMTFDGMRTYAGSSDLVAAASFNQAWSNTALGSWSYGGAKLVHYPTCTTDYMIDSGVRGEGAPEGGLLSLNTKACGTATSPQTCDIQQLNDKIQQALITTRSFGGTPTAGALDDLSYHIKNDFIDPYASCRPRYAVLLTDGYPDDDFRLKPSPGCNCKAENNCGAMENPDAMHCPYPTPTEAAYNLVHRVGQEDPPLQQLFVVGMSITDDASRQALNAIASNGGSIDTDNDGNEAFFADTPATLTATLDNLFGGLSRPVSRSVPAFATSVSGAQYQISAGFQISNDRTVNGMAPPWAGIIERRRFLCSGTALSSPTIDTNQGDVFQDVLNTQNVRSLWTSLPAGATTNLVLNGAIDRGTASAICGSTYCSNTPLTSVTPALFSVADAAAKKTLTDWMYGEAGSIRANRKLGDIYHSSPAVVGFPSEDPGDESYSDFRSSDVIANRPLMMYIGSNDGILHAFSVEDYPPAGVSGSTVYTSSYRAGQELWGFVPPIELDKLKTQLSSHQYSMDGTPVAKDVFFSKTSSGALGTYHTVLITGMRAGGHAYEALDVTDPTQPKFLWQFTDTVDMGLTYGQPEIVQATYEWPLGSGAAPSIRAMAILPGGVGSQGSGPGCAGAGPTTPTFKVVGSPGTRYTTVSDAEKGTTTTLPHRSDVRCWKEQGRALYFVDVETGTLIKKIFDDDGNSANGTIFQSPVSGSPTAYQDSIATVATEGFVVDADGLIWRIDLSATDPKPLDPINGWTVRPFHDIFWDYSPTQGETTYERPILSLDSQRRLVVIVGTGDTDDFTKQSIQNRIVSLTEVTSVTQPTQPGDYKAGMNWELGVGSYGGFVASELVTGTMALFDSQLYAASFISVVDPTNACSFGRGRLWSLDYIQRDTAHPNTINSGAVATFPPLRLATVNTDTSINDADSGASLFNVTVAQAESNLLIQGLGTTQRATCQAAAAPINSYFSPSLVSIRQPVQPSISIVAQASSGNSKRLRAGSTLGSLQVSVNRPYTFSRVSAWAGSID
jgi:type IV pilus assembly protein PilY1